MKLARAWLWGLVAATLAGGAALADNVTADHEEDGKWLTADDIPTFKVAEDGTVDWYTFSGFRRYHSECHVCHGPDGLGSTYAPGIAKSAVTLDYYEFLDIVVNGKQEGNLVMPSFGTNKNVMCYLDDIYVYLKAMGSDAIPRGRPAKHADKPEPYAENENACMG
jgi:methanol metabolism-related c-type cytochrome